jgi:hypothetical protein
LLVSGVKFLDFPGGLSDKAAPRSFEETSAIATDNFGFDRVRSVSRYLQKKGRETVVQHCKLIVERG